MKPLLTSTIVLAGVAGAALANEPVWDANKVVLESHELADGVFAVVPQGAEEMAKAGYPIATSGGFVIGERGVLVIDSMLNERLNRQLMDLIAAETDKPVLYMVNTSYHGDHSYGNQYLPEEVEIIQHAFTAEYIHEHIDADKAFMMQNFGTGRGIEEIEATEADILVAEGGAITVDLGDINVDIKDYGFAQTGGDLFVSVPDANVLWTGNPIAAEAPALPWLLDGHLVETRETLQEVRAMVNDDTQIVPGHGPVTDAAAIDWAISYLSEVETQVGQAVAEGLTLEETVAEVEMADYQGYALFGWVHPHLNVPAAYTDLHD